MTQASITFLSNKVLVDRLIETTHSNDRHHDTDPQLLAKKWGIGIIKAKTETCCFFIWTEKIIW